jgi:ABC-type sugar transport system permease subunit
MADNRWPAMAPCSVVSEEGGWSRFEQVTLDALKLFDLIFVLTRGNPNHATEMIATWMFATTFRHYKMGYGAAMSVVLFLMILGFSIIYIRWAGRGEDTE